MTDNSTSGPGGVIPVARYSSARQAPQERYAAWRDGSLLSFGRLYDTQPLVAFDAETAATQLGDVGFSHSTMTSQNWARTPELIRADGADPLMVSIRFSGSSRGDADGRDVQIGPGSIALSDFSRPQSFFADTGSSAVLAIPRGVAERVLPRVRTLHGLVIPPAAATLLHAHARALAEALDAGLPASQGARLGRVALDLLAMGVAQSAAMAPPPPDARATQARLAAEAVIDRKLGSATLNVANLCRWIGVSRSTLYRLFDADGGVQAFIGARRLARVEADLRRGGQERISDIAERWGFCDAAYLARSFRDTYGQTPTDYRRSHAAPDEVRPDR